LDSLPVLDSSAVLAVIFAEPGADKVAGKTQGALLSTVNLVEVQTRLILRGSDPDFAWRGIQKLDCEICSLDEKQARIASEIIGKTKPLGLSLGDRVCLALAIQRKGKVYTTDRAWTSLSLGVEIEVIR